jgi:hypothetical protein
MKREPADMYWLRVLLPPLLVVAVTILALMLI